jgi:hypothetical protein
MAASNSRGNRLTEQSAGASQPIERRARIALVTVAAEVIGAKRVDREQHDVEPVASRDWAQCGRGPQDEIVARHVASQHLGLETQLPASSPDTTERQFDLVPESFACAMRETAPQQFDPIGIRLKCHDEFDLLKTEPPKDLADADRVVERPRRRLEQ